MRRAEFGMGNESFISTRLFFPTSLPLCTILPEAGAAVLRYRPVGGGILVASSGAHGRRRITVVMAHDRFSVAAPAAHVAEAVQSAVDRTLSLRMHDVNSVW